jgi:hypothetical protein
MKRSAPIQRRTPLVRKTPLRRSPIRRKSRPKMTPARKNAKGQPCTLNFPGCYPGPDNELVVLCHLRMFNGGGTGQKPHDSEAVLGCLHCHDILDGRTHPVVPFTPEYLWECIARALVATLRIQRAAGVLIYKGES